MNFDKWLQQLNQKRQKPYLAIIPYLGLQTSYISRGVNQYDVEENISHLMTLARIALERGETEKAIAILEMGIKISDEYKTYYAMPYMYDILASIAFAMGEFGKAEALLVQVFIFF